MDWKGPIREIAKRKSAIKICILDQKSWLELETSTPVRRLIEAKFRQPEWRIKSRKKNATP